MGKTEADKLKDNGISMAKRTTLSCIVTRTDAEAFRAYAQKNGTTVNAILQHCVSECLGRPLTTRRNEPVRGDVKSF